MSSTSSISLPNMSSASSPSCFHQMVNLVFFFLYPLLCTLAVLSADNYPTGDIAVNCGSTGISTAFNKKEWIGDIVESKSTTSPVIKGSSTTSTALHNLDSTDPIPYKTARISRTQFSYTFQVSPGQKLIRLHFSLASYRRFKKFKDLFTVEAGAFTLLGNFSASLTADALGVKSFIKEYCINIDQNQPLTIIFSPEHSQSDKTYAFVNGIEVISMPRDLYYSRDDDLGARVVGQKSRFFIDNSTVLEIMERLHFRLDPIPLIDNFGKYEKIKDFTWKTSVDVGFGYLVRLHFCERGLLMAETRNSVYSVFINDMIAETNVDIGKERSVVSGIHLYRDYMVIVKGHKEEGGRDLTISLQLKDELVSELFKGLEILKLSNHENSLASPNPSPRRRTSKSTTVLNLLSFFGHGNAIATGAVIVISLVNIITYKLRKIWEANSTDCGYKPSALTEKLCRPFSLAEIQSATENFNDALVIGRGGFGKVYRGFIRKEQQIVAIKRLKSNSRQGAREFWTEVETLSKLQHTNLISLIGYCNEGQEMILLYEYIPSGTLADNLFGFSRESGYHSSLSWEQRLRICTGVGRGLDYLHTGTDQGIIHRDIKASNILLNENLEAKISDFGLAKARNRSRVQSYVSTNVKGTYGYFDPDYLRTRRLTRKSDTYAFGVVLLEVLCERRALDRRVEEDKQNLTIWAQDCISKGEIDQLVAPSLRTQISPESLMTFLEVAKRCLHDEPNKRPTMAQVVVQLEFALEQQESSNSSAPVVSSSDSIVPCTGETLHSISGEIEEKSSEDEQNIPPSLTERRKMVQNGESSSRGLQVHNRNKNAYKLPWFWPRNALWKRANITKKNQLSITEYFGEEVESHRFDLATIAAATNNFSLPNKIGAGGFGDVYKGLLSTGQEVAVKRRSSYYYQASDEFKREVLLLSKLHHPNLIKLLGYCIDGEEMITVYELVEKKLVYDQLLDEIIHALGWTIRFKIIIGIARGVLHLHQDSGLRIIHRDIKARGILLDREMNPKISDFELATTLEEHHIEIMLPSRVAGTFGYMSPEYAMEGIFSLKSDVFSFGVLLLEIVSGRRTFRDFPDSIECAWKMWKEGKALEFLDISMKDEFPAPADEALRCIQVGLLCVQERPGDRPMMQSVLEMLEGENPSLPQPTTPAYSGSTPTDEVTFAGWIPSANEVAITESVDRKHVHKTATFLVQFKSLFANEKNFTPTFLTQSQPSIFSQVHQF